VCSPDGLIREPEIEALQTELVKIEREIPHTCGGENAAGFQVVVVAVERLAGGSVSAASFTRNLHNRWGVGRRACGDGVLVMIAVRDREAYITTGDAAGERLSSSSISNVIGASECRR
jgi:uncharacterized membrane protein YgcG